MTTEQTLPPMPIISGVKHWDLIRAWGLQCFEAGRPQWQPIETAPKDGTRVLLHRAPKANCQAVCTVRYQCEEWLVAGSGNEFFDPTHWMPLPEPPAVTSTARGPQALAEFLSFDGGPQVSLWQAAVREALTKGMRYDI